MTRRPTRRPRANGRRSSRSLWAEYQRRFPKYFWGPDTHLANIFVDRASGSTLRDVSGREYIDLSSQWATNNLGNVPRELLPVASQALERYGFLIPFMNPHPPMLDLAERLLAIRPSPNLTRVLLEVSGTGAAEAAVKYAVETTERPLVLSFLGQYHGLSIAAGAIGSLSSHERRFWEAYSGGTLHLPYPQSYRRPRGMSHAEYGNWILEYLRDELLARVAAPDRIAGVIFEPVACEAGVWIPPAGFVRGLSRVCREFGWKFIDDEVEAGLGRTGRMWAVEHFGVAPDLVAIGKALSGGLIPIAAVLGTEELMGEHEVAAGTTFGGHPAACAVAARTIEILRRDRIPARSAKLGRHLLARLGELDRIDAVGDTRGLGLCAAVELVRDRRTKEPYPGLARRVFFECLRRGTVLLYNYGDHILRVEPPLTISEEELDRGLDTLEAALRSTAS